ncbi:MAG: hypothetical protein E4H39_02360 [Syntrophobacterales bacterium]|nr:MAG: hypothetical protein E4H39_02360 [Syntrophobacterales bacterium]
MGEILKDKHKVMSRRCRVCGKIEGEDDDLLLNALEDMIDLSEEEESAWEWFSEKLGERSLSDILHYKGSYTKKEMAHIFVIANLVERLLGTETLCESCYRRTMEGRAFS